MDAGKSKLNSSLGRPGDFQLLLAHEASAAKFLVLIEDKISRCRPVLHSQGGKTAAPCILRVIVDGMAMPAGTSLDNVTPNEVAGMEIYAGPSSTPVELAHYQEDTWCGAIMIWTKGG